MRAELKLKEAQKEIALKDAKIKELAELVRKLSGGTIETEPNSTDLLRNSHDKSVSDLNARVDFTATEKRLQAQVLGTGAPTFSRMNPNIDQGPVGYEASGQRRQQRHNYSNEGNDDFWYQTGDDDMLK